MRQDIEKILTDLLATEGTDSEYYSSPADFCYLHLTYWKRCKQRRG